MIERKIYFPVWLEYSGLPSHLNTHIRREAWSVFKKLVEIDCEKNSHPGTFEISLTELSQFTGVSVDILNKIILAFRKKNLVASFLPEHPDEPALFQINYPLPTPISPMEIKQKYAVIFPPGKDFFRYVDSFAEEIDYEDENLRKIVELYFNSIGLKMNTFILDELRLIRQRFPITLIEKVFKRAKYFSIPSLHWVLKELFRISENVKKGTKRKTKYPPKE